MNAHYPKLDIEAGNGTLGETTGHLCRERNAAALGLADWLCLAAAPTFALMALLTGALGGSSPDILCAQDVSLLTGMVPMYLLMSAFHSAPWLKLIARSPISSTGELRRTAA